jgi:hypothetical protein
MDLWKLGKKAVFVPTPGQTEQEYLANELKKNGTAFYQTQSQFNLIEALRESENYKGFEGFNLSANLLSKTVTELLKKNLVS